MKRRVERNTGEQRKKKSWVLSHIRTVHSVEISRAPCYYSIYIFFKLNTEVEIKNLCNKTAFLSLKCKPLENFKNYVRIKICDGYKWQYNFKIWSFRGPTAVEKRHETWGKFGTFRRVEWYHLRIENVVTLLQFALLCGYETWPLASREG